MSQAELIVRIRSMPTGSLSNHMQILGMSLHLVKSQATPVVSSGMDLRSIESSGEIRIGCEYILIR